MLEAPNTDDGLAVAFLKAASAGPAPMPTATAATATVAATRRGRVLRGAEWRGRYDVPDPVVGRSWSSVSLSSDH